MDEFSELLRSFRLGGSAFINASLKAPWAIQTPTAAELGQCMGAASEHIIPYHYVSAGRLVAQLADGMAEFVEKGEAIVFPHGDVHRLSSEVGLSPLRIATEAIVRLTKIGAISRVKYGGEGVVTEVICGFFACDDALSERFIAPLPRMFKFRVPEDSAASLLPLAVQRSHGEKMSSTAGNAGVLCKLSELLFAEALRACVDQIPDMENGWIAGLKDPVVGRALQLIHAQPGREWTLVTLANAVGTSRTTLSERFIQRLQKTPMQYLMSWRLRLAANSIAEGNLIIKQIAAVTGFASTAAFSRAFKRELGKTPSEWARNARPVT